MASTKSHLPRAPGRSGRWGFLYRVNPETAFMGVILRSKATKNLIAAGSAEILRGVYPEYTEGLRMTGRSFRMGTSSLHTS